MNTLKIIFSLALFLIAAQVSAQRLIVVSDLDETLRQANVENKIDAGIRIIKGVRPYKASQILFKDIKEKFPDAKFYYLSNSYKFLYDGKKWLEKNGYPAGVVFQRKLTDKSSTFKIKKLTEVVNSENPSAEWMFFGDNVEKDPMIYQEILASSTIRSPKIFIRDARLVSPSEDQVIYFQHEAQLVDDLNLSAKNQAALKTLTLDDFIPKFLFSNLQKRLVKSCQAEVKICKNEADEKISSLREEFTRELSY